MFAAMRLPLRHAPTGQDAPLRRCAHLEALAVAALGLPLGPAMELVTARRSRGRYGNALQWHFGLDTHDGLPQLDWEDRIEIKMLTVWRQQAGKIRCDKLKVCDQQLDPWHKLSNVLWVLVDRVTRVVVGSRLTHLAGPMRERLERCWGQDPHFDNPVMFVEAREQDGRQAPAYYLAARWFREEGILPESLPGVYRYDAKWFRESRHQHGRKLDPLVALWRPGERELACPRCQGRLLVEPDRVAKNGWAPAKHTMPLGDACALRGHLVVDATKLPLDNHHPYRSELEAGIERRVAAEQVWRLADRVIEPEDHLH